jgi:hypothetical protein
MLEMFVSRQLVVFSAAGCVQCSWLCSVQQQLLLAVQAQPWACLCRAVKYMQLLHFSQRCFVLFCIFIFSQ